MFPEPSPVPCAACGEPVDALRAISMRMSLGGPLYYCSAAHAREHRWTQLEQQAQAPASLTPRQEPAQALDAALLPLATTSGTPEAQDPQSRYSPEPDDAPDTADDEFWIAGVVSPPQGTDDSAEPESRSSDERKLSLEDDGPGKESPRGVAHRAGPGRATAHLRPRLLEGKLLIAQWLPLLLALSLSLGTWLLAPASAPQTLSLLLVVAGWTLVSLGLGMRLSRGSLAQRGRWQTHLGGQARRISSGGESRVGWAELRAGEELRLVQGDVLLADAIVVSGAALVLVVPESEIRQEVSEGQRLPAGAQLEAGELRVVCAQTGLDATFFRLAEGSQENDSLLVHSAQQVGSRVAPLALLISFGLALWWTRSVVDAASVAVANFAALGHPLPVLLLRQVHRKWLLALARRGIHLSRGALDEAAHVTQCVFCTRGTVLSGEPELAEVHALRDSAETEVLALAAGAESVVEHPAASSILRAAHARGIGPDRARGHDVIAGMGVICFSSHGDSLVVGNRDLLLRQRISIAAAEELLRKLESRGRMGILVAKSERLIGVLALHDAVRVGAKAAIQLLIDGHIEPILLSGDTRSTCEALGRALSVEHIRPEVPARERGAVVKQLTLGGSPVAVVGHSPLDDSALSGANVPVTLDAAALPPQRGGLAVLSSDVLLAADALLSLQRLRREASLTWALSALPTLLGVLSATSLLFPPVVAPILAALGDVFSSVWVAHRRQDCSPSPRYGTPLP